MKREVRRERKLPAFSIGVGELEVLSQRLMALFDETPAVYVSININLKGENLSFDSVSDVVGYSGNLTKISDFRIYFSQGDRSVSIRSTLLFGRLPEVYASADSEAWCAGALETVYSFLSAYRLWYGWFLSAPLGWVLFALVNVPNVAQIVMKRDQFVPKIVVAGWVAMTLVLGVLYVFSSKILPSSVIVFKRTESFMRRHVGELSLVVAIISAALTIVGWFVAK